MSQALRGLLRCRATPGRFQGRPQMLLLLVAQRGLDELTAERRDLGDDLVRGGLLHQDEQRGGAGLQVLAQVLHEVVVDAGVGRGTPGGPGRGTDGRTEQRHEEEQPDDTAPQRPARCTRRRVVHGLMQLDLPVLAPLDDHDVLELDEVLLGQLEHFLAHLIGRGEVVVGDDEQIAHTALLGSLCNFARVYERS